MYKRLYKINEGKLVDGVCGGIAQFFGLDPTLIRLAWILFSATGGGIFAYIVCAIVIPREP
ncbi:PspC domain-containing protein [Oscillospiraceae bacterium 38-13]